MSEQDQSFQQVLSRLENLEQAMAQTTAAVQNLAASMLHLKREQDRQRRPRPRKTLVKHA